MRLTLVALALVACSAQAQQVSCQTIGNMTFCSDGTSYNRIGNQTFGSDGSTANRIGNQTFINPPPPTYVPPVQSYPYYQPPQIQVQPRRCGYNVYGQYVCI